MGENKWSPEQLSILESRRENLLVSAAAGAGKTAVLVERIIRLISEPGSNVDIDSLLVMTFTNAAAAEMRDRIGRMLGERLEKDSSNKRLLKQQMLVHSASIVTIDSFCLSVVREFFHAVNLDPSFKIAQTAESELLRSEVMNELLEEEYTRADPEFLRLIESYGTKRDESVAELVYRLAGCADAHPYPMEYLKELDESFDITSADELNGAGWMAAIFDYVLGLAQAALDLNARAVSFTGLPGGPSSFFGVLNSDREIFERIVHACEKRDYDILADTVLNTVFERRPRTPKDCDPDVAGRVVALRDRSKKLIADKVCSIIELTSDELLSQVAVSSLPMRALIRLTGAYLEKYAEAKRDRNLLEFSDLEHYTLDILVHHQPGGSYEITPEALELRARYNEIFVDEYQDSNSVQESITEAIAGNYDTKPYTFTVGDVKQSIYKFRMAKPEMFIDRFERYRAHPEQGRVIVLGRNYRSRAEVLDSTNDVFRASMQHRLGRIEYDEEASLKYGGTHEDDENFDYRTEIILARTEEENPNSPARQQAEARAVAQKIRDLVASKVMVGTGEKRHRIEYGDIVILLRVMKGWLDAYKEAFTEFGIPAFADAGTEFLETFEIRMIINYIRILDNPCQDIPYTAVLHSPLGGFSEDELVSIRMGGGMDIPFCEAVGSYAVTGPDSELRGKVQRFLEVYDELSVMNVTGDIDKIIAALYEKTGVYAYCAALRGGDRRTSNLDLLLEYAVQYEASSYSGLFSFVRYLEQLLTAELDLDEASGIEASGAVRIMTIHKSKGLEFPVVVVAGGGRELINKDARSSVVISPDFGIGSTVVDIERRTVAPTLRLRAIQMQMNLDNLAEELRLLYVAMTRAREKLYIAGCLRKPDDAMEEWTQEAESGAEQYSYVYLSGMKNYLDIVMPAALRHGEHFTVSSVCAGEPDCSPVNASPVLASDFEDEADAELMKQLAFVYPYPDRSVLPIKYTVSELKREAMRLEEEEGTLGTYLFGDKATEILEASPNGGMPANVLGTLYHKIMQFLPFDTRGTEGVITFLAGLEKRGIISKEEKEAIVPERIARFLETGLCRDMLEADRNGLLRREQPFVLGVRACDISPEKFAGFDEMIPVQGVIDCMFEKNGELIILDYKTDRIDDVRELAAHYHTQLEYYSEAAERITHRKVARRILYSITLGEMTDV